MSFKRRVAHVASDLATQALRHLAHRPAANMPGKIALKIDPTIIAEERYKLTQGSLVVVGTNGKTTITNMIADALEAQGLSIACNRTGANLSYGVAATLLQTKAPVDWGVFESDELWLARTLPQLQATYVLLLNLFRDQLDRYGEIDRIQDAIVSALEESPCTTLIYNADDPLCATIAERVKNPKITFGIAEDMHLTQNQVSDTQMCHFCSGMFEYEYRQYGQLGAYTCQHCGFKRPALDFWAHNVVLGNPLTFDLSHTVGNGKVSLASADDTTDGAAITTCALRAPQAGPYMVYNVMAAYIAAHLVGVDDETFQKALDCFDPQNGRLQSLAIEGRPLLLNLAKNPTGFNQNLKIITQTPGKKVVAFFINDNEADGHDISWIWDCDFEELAQEKDIVVYAGGIRKNDLQVRLKYAGINAALINSVDEMVDDALKMPADWQMFAIANYTSLPAVRQALMARADKTVVSQPTEGTYEPASSVQSPEPVAVETAQYQAAQAQRPVDAEHPIRVVHLYPDLLNLYGDGGNVCVLVKRMQWRGIPVEVEQIHYGDSVDLTQADIVMMGGGPDREQKLATECLMQIKHDLSSYVDNGGVLLAICGGYQISGDVWLMGDEPVEGLDLIEVTTKRAGTGFDRLIDNIALDSPLATHPVVGYENHAGRTYLSDKEKTFGRVVSKTGHGNNDDSHADGVIHNHMIGTYLHGPLLGKNPEIADQLIVWAFQQRGYEVVDLSLLDDSVELAANDYMADRLDAKLNAKLGVKQGAK